MEIRCLGDLVRPVTPNYWILYLRQQLMNKISVRKDTHNFYKRTAGLAHDGQHGISDGVLKPRTDNAGFLWIVKFIHQSYDTGYHKMFLFFRFRFQHVESHWPLGIRRIEIDDVFRAFGGYPGKNSVDKIAVRIYDSKSLACFDILYD